MPIATFLGGGGDLTSFADGLQTTNSLGGLGKNWLVGAQQQGSTQTTGPGRLAYFDITTSSLDGNNALVWGLNLVGDAGGTVRGWPLFANPVSILRGLYGLNQFAQVTHVYAGKRPSGAGLTNSMRAGLFVFNTAFQNSGATAYCFNVQTDGSYQFLKFSNGSVTVFATGAAAAIVNGDVLKLTVDATTTPGSSIVKVFQNGTLLVTQTDIGGITTGTPGLYSQDFQTAGVGIASIEHRTFSCGPK